MQRALTLVLLLLSVLGGCVAKRRPGQGTWSPINSGSGVERSGYAAAWTGDEIVIWGGVGINCTDGICSDGAAYNPRTDQWRRIPPGPIQGRIQAAAVWATDRLLIWGGHCLATPLGPCSGGVEYYPATDSWMPMEVSGEPSQREGHSAIWTGRELIVWGGGPRFTNMNFADGGRYDPIARRWTPVSVVGAPSPRNGHTAVWTGAEMIIWGGYAGGPIPTDGGRYDPTSDSWRSLSPKDAPSGRAGGLAVWTGSEMIIWGGNAGPTEVSDHRRYNPVTDRWLNITGDGAPSNRQDSVGDWTGKELIVWGGANGWDCPRGFCIDGARYDPARDRWTPMTENPRMPVAEIGFWTGVDFIAWNNGTGGPDFPLSIGGSRYVMEAPDMN